MTAQEFSKLKRRYYSMRGLIRRDYPMLGNAIVAECTVRLESNQIHFANSVKTLKLALIELGIDDAKSESQDMAA